MKKIFFSSKFKTKLYSFNLNSITKILFSIGVNDIITQRKKIEETDTNCDFLLGSRTKTAVPQILVTNGFDNRVNDYISVRIA